MSGMKVVAFFLMPSGSHLVIAAERLKRIASGILKVK
ncbi:hypothetical protein BofuT4_uP027390.1 [Botrytis cinerea T4]|uniref:Uncharacterized protein n=1 Tax=Botryotinia fuckeliana (strain T4) TaxID=999810 RepID=G2Y9Z2_BOTF4|nr:hypothetical protein BofuT4_uP027390.1 [Botrytis cinerea T4]